MGEWISIQVSVQSRRLGWRYSGIWVCPATSELVQPSWVPLFYVWLPLWLWFSGFYAYLFHTYPLIKDFCFPSPTPPSCTIIAARDAAGSVYHVLCHVPEGPSCSMFSQGEIASHTSLHYKGAQMTLGILRGTTLWQWQSDVVLGEWLLWKCH